jgi:hypothetical protein
MNISHTFDENGNLLTYTQIDIGRNFPVQLMLILETSKVAFVVVNSFKTIYDMSTDDVDAYFDMEGFSIGYNSYKYNTQYDYKNIPSMLKWLQKQKLILD